MDKVILLSGYLQYRPEERDDVVAGLIEVARRSREDPGCVDYWWAEDLETPCRFRFLECWESEEQFTAHRDQPYEHEFMGRYVNNRVIGADATAYDPSVRRSAMGM
jgi:quinol monooxygenase YgiN